MMLELVRDPAILDIRHQQSGRVAADVDHGDAHGRQFARLAAALPAARAAALPAARPAALPAGPVRSAPAPSSFAWWGIGSPARPASRFSTASSAIRSRAACVAEPM